VSDLWKSFWSKYRHAGTVSEDTLFQQVGRTVNGEPIAPQDFAATIAQIEQALQLGPDDVLFEYCCGNGLVTHELARRVRHVVGVDFMEHLVEAARRFRAAPNIRYHVGDALQPIAPWLDGAVPDRFLMASALQHFEPAGLDTILANLCAVAKPGTFRFLLTGIPDDARKWNFYDTAERRARHEANVAAGDVLNDGLGRWWTQAEIAAIAQRHGLHAEVSPEPTEICNYRMAALLS
jgi:SAM-dependent methyltransferase